MEFANTGEFFSKDLELGDLIRFLYGLSRLEYRLFEEIIILNNPTSQYLKERLKRRNIGMVNKALKHLSEVGLIIRTKVSIEDRTGFHYTYSNAPLSELKEQIKKKIEDWYSRSITKIDQMETYYQNKFQLVPLTDEA